MKRYRVKIGYYDLLFRGKLEAIDFADKAFDALEEDNKKVSVVIVEVPDPEENEENEEEGDK